ncbi:cathepsin L1 [Anabrus simplex]|uniref:cathepsin L1 n=1 Tax=Anabrus simplex TaxID=316456 RepID=UPI0034DCE67E
MRLLLMLLAVTVMADTTFYSDEDLKEWNDYKVRYGKQYPLPAEDEYHLNIFLHHKDMIDRHNAKYARGEVSYKMGYNQFSDMKEEQCLRLNGFKSSLFQKTSNDDMKFQQ